MNVSAWGGWAMSTYYTQRAAFDVYGSEAVAGQAALSFLNMINAAGGGGINSSVAGWCVSHEQDCPH